MQAKADISALSEIYAMTSNLTTLEKYQKSTPVTLPDRCAYLYNDR